MKTNGYYDRRWLVNDVRERYVQESDVLTDEVLTSTLSAGINRLEYVVSFELNGTTYYVADRPKYLGDIFVEGRIKIPEIEQQLSDILTANLSFSEIKIEIINIDKKFTSFFTGGEFYDFMIGSKVQVFVGLRDNEKAKFRRIFVGYVSHESGVEYTKDYFIINARDVLDKVNTNVPLPVLSPLEFENMPQDNIGKPVPFVLGFWSDGFLVDYSGGAASTTVLVNDVRQQEVCKVAVTEPSFHGGILAYNVGGHRFVFSVGGTNAHDFYPNKIFHCLLKRGNYLYHTYFNETPLFTGGFWGCEVYALVADYNALPLAYVYEQGDVLLISTDVGLVPNFDETNSVGYRQQFSFIQHTSVILQGLGRLSKSVVESASWQEIYNFIGDTSNLNREKDLNCRTWIADNSTNVLSYVLSLLSQFRCQMYVDHHNNNIAFLKYRAEDNFPQIGEMFTVNQNDIVEKSFKIKPQKTNFFTSGVASYCFNPVAGANIKNTGKFFINQTTVNKIGRRIDKQLDFPNIHEGGKGSTYSPQAVENHLKGYVRLASAGLEEVSFEMARTGIQFNLGDFILVTFKLGGVNMEQVPMQIKALSFNTEGTGVKLTLTSFLNFAFPTYEPPHKNRNLSSYDKTLLEVAN